MGYVLTGDQQKTASRRIGEILRQFGQDEYPYDPEAALNVLQAFSEGRFEVVGAASQPILRLISAGETLVIDPTDGAETIPASEGVFAYIDPDFKNWGADEASGPTPATPVAVHELARDATFAQVFSANPGAFCLTQSQILNFIKKYRNWLRTDGYATFFLFRLKGALFVAHIRFNRPDRLLAYVRRFEYDCVWYAEDRHRVVLPQL